MISGRRLSGRRPAFVRRSTTVSRCGAAARPVEHDKLGIEALQYDLSAVAVLSLLVCPFARLQLAPDINPRTFLQILPGHLGKTFVEDHDAVPFSALAALAGCLVAP